MQRCVITTAPLHRIKHLTPPLTPLLLSITAPSSAWSTTKSTTKCGRGKEASQPYLFLIPHLRRDLYRCKLQLHYVIAKPSSVDRQSRASPVWREGGGKLAKWVTANPYPPRTLLIPPPPERAGFWSWANGAGGLPW